ncbi:helix-turn-helix domain-containing protein [Actinopolymorpha rutila]|uniref:Transcriptional regulator with XRE-family HTH domain n=1 Tax=Actinopolymorpha rutila TaxID=446787 RepID=A0A852ZRR3_9ACTN|nr:helix-turn-helix transcriptional regulator [Actinopolymorpha rutila]NYH92099.1 transcriptional regulator with XRE-family HTH domain [Actinopolymorpha rutila]
MTTSALKQARLARGWSQSRLVAGMESYARRHTIQIAATASLHVYVSEWENGRRRISSPYAGILRGILGLTEDELPPPGDEPSSGNSWPDGYKDLAKRVRSYRAVSGSVVGNFMAQTELLRSLDRQLGAAQLVDQMQSHLATIQDALTFSVLPASRRPLALALGSASTLAAWQALDVGAVDRAWRHYEVAKSAARDAEAPAHLAYAMGEQAYVLAEAGELGLAVELVREAAYVGAGVASGKLMAWVASAEAELCARAGIRDDCLRALERADCLLPPGDDARDEDVPSIFLNASHLARWRGNALALIGDEHAVAGLYSALGGLDPSFTRAEAGLRCDLAQAHMARGEYDEAAAHLSVARLVTSRTGSVRHRRRIDRLTGASS